MLTLLDELNMMGRDRDAALRLPILDRYVDRGTIAMGKVESGTVMRGQKITVMPTRETYKIEAVWANETPVMRAAPGENVLIKIAGAGVENIQKGFVVCGGEPCRR